MQNVVSMLLHLDTDLTQHALHSVFSDSQRALNSCSVDHLGCQSALKAECAVQEQLITSVLSHMSARPTEMINQIFAELCAFARFSSDGKKIMKNKGTSEDTW